MKDTVTGYKIYEEVKKAASKFNLPLERLVSVATDGVPAMVGSKIGFLAKLKEELTSLNLANSNFAAIHCIIHQENLCAKSLKFENIMRVVVSTINFIKSRALNHHQFKEFLEELESEYGDLVYYCAVRWLSKGKMLQRFYSLREEVCAFLEMKGKFVPELKDDNWICDLAFLVDITTHLNDLNLKLQKQNQLIHEMYSHVKAFQTKLQLWENQLRTGDAFHFPTLAKHGSKSGYDGFAVELNELKKELNSRFNNFRAREADFNLFGNPFNADVEKVRKELQMELIELQSDEFLRQKFKEASLMHFYGTLPEENCPKVVCFARRYSTMFGSTYKCQQLFSRMKIIKSKTRSRLIDIHLEDNLRVATSQIPVNIEKLMENVQHQVSH